MGKSRGFTVSGSHPTVRSIFRFPFPTSTVERSSDQFPISGCSEEPLVEGSGREDASKGRYRASPKHFFSRVLQPSISCPKEIRRLETSDRLVQSKQSLKHSFVQDGDSRVYSGKPPAGPVGDFSRPLGRVFSHPYGSVDPQVPSLHGTGCGLPVSLPSFWSRGSSQGVYHCGQGSKEDSYKVADLGVSIHRRLAKSGSLAQSVCRGDSKATQTHTDVGLDGQSREVRTCSYSDLQFSGLYVRPSQGCGVSYRSSFSKPSKGIDTSPNLSVFYTKTCDENTGSYGLHGKARTSRSTSYAPTPVRVEETVASQEKPRLQNHSGCSCDKLSEVVVGQEECHGNSAVTSSKAIHIHLHGCIAAGMGCSHGGVHGSGNLDNFRISAPHQCSRTKGCVQSLKSSSTQTSSAQGHSSSNRQYHSSLLHQQTGWDQISTNGGSILGPSVLVQEQGDQSPGSAFGRSNERPGRSVVSSEADSAYRMVSRSEGFRHSVSSVVQTSNRSICHQDESQTTPVCVASPGSSSDRDRRNVQAGHLVKERFIRFPSTDTVTSNSGKATSKSELSNVASGALLGNKSLSRTPDATVSGASGGVAEVPTFTKATPSGGISSESTGSQSSCILAEDQLSSQGFSGDCIDRILNPFRDSTRHVYEAKWNRFGKYCEERNITASLVTIPQLAEFFLFLFNTQKFQPSTIDGYRSALNPHLLHRLGDLGSNPVLSKLLKSFHRDRPRTHPRVQSWDLSIVLYSLSREPFEPLKSISFKYLTWKTAFLIALGSGRRCSEIHAIKRNKIYESNDWDTVTFQIDHFLCKNQQYDVSGEMFKSFVIPALCSSVARDAKDERALCPIRALRYYLRRSAELGKVKDRTALFVPMIDTKGELAKSTLSHWIKDCITYCLKSCSTENASFHKVRAHDVRGLAATWCLNGGVPTKDIMHACTWRNQNTFTKFYLKDSVSNNEGYRFGPIIAAQSLIKN